MDVPEQQDHRDVVAVEARPVEPSSPRRPIPPFIAKTVNLCVNCVTGAGRLVRDPLRRRYHRHYHPRHRFGRHHLVADLAFVGAITALLGVNAWLLLGKPLVFSSNVRLAWRTEHATVRSGDAANLTLAFRYDGDEPLDRATVALQLPDHLLIVRTAPGTYDPATRTMRLNGPIVPGASGDIHLVALTDALDGTDLAVRATFYGSGARHSERVSSAVTIPVRGIAFTFAFEGPSVVRSGHPANIHASYAAVGDDGGVIVGARAFRVLIGGPLVAGSTVTAARGAIVRRGEVRWPFHGEQALREMVGESLVLTPPNDIDGSAFPTMTKFTYRVTPELILMEDALGVPTARISGPPLMIDVAGDLLVSASARYFTPEGDQVGRGPLPPRVGMATKYWVTLDAQSLIRDADRVIVHAMLPPEVEWTGRTMSAVGDTPRYDPVRRTVTWSIGKLGRVTEQRAVESASFELAIIPRSEQLGSPAKLLEPTSAQGIDDLGTPLAATAPVVTTELPLDQRAHGKGSVMR